MVNTKKSAVALGSFDGLHKGHKAVLTCALSCKERGFVPIALLFTTHPLLSLTGSAPEEILQAPKRLEMLEEYGTGVYEISFDNIKDMSPEEFFREILIGRLNAGAVCCGSNYRFGKGGSGTAEQLKVLCNDAGIDCLICPDVTCDGQLISSTRIRKAIKEGCIPLANRMLGYEFGYCAKVMHGYKRGHLIGFPTINQYFDEGFIHPKSGVYASVTTVDGIEYPSVTNIGLSPSFEDNDFRSETNILGFDGDLYDQFIEVSLLKYIRSEKKFGSMQELSHQIKSDSEKSESIFVKRGVTNV